MGQRTVPWQLQPAESALRGAAGAWAERFYRCRSCRAWWAVAFNPKDLLYEMTRALGPIEAALRSDATLEQAWPYLFATAPIDEMFETYLYAGNYDPQAALDRLLEKFGDPTSTPSNQYDILRMLSRLLSLRHPEHRALQGLRGWVWERAPSEAEFRRPLLEFERRFELEKPGYRGFRDHGREAMQTLREALERDATGRRKIFRGKAPDLDWRRDDLL